MITRVWPVRTSSERAGAGYEVPVLEPQALELLSHYDERALHYESASFRPDMLPT